MDHEGLRRAARRIEAAFAGQDEWSTALDAFAAASHSFGAALLPITAGHEDRPTSRNLEAVLEEYKAYWHRYDFRRASVPKMIKDGVAVDQDIVTYDEMRRLPFYAEYLWGHGLRWFAGIPLKDGAHLWTLTVQRKRDQEPFDEAEQEVLRRLSAGLGRALAHARQLAATRAAGMLHSFDLSATPALLLDRQGRVVEANQAARRIEAGCIGIVPGRKPSLRPPFDKRLDLHLHAIRHPDPAHADPHGRPVIVRFDWRRPLILRGCRTIGCGNSVDFGSADVLLRIEDLEVRSPPGPTTFAEAFGLSARQAEIAVTLGQGLTLKECAEQLEVGVETVRTTLQRVFQKVGVTRQAELMLILERFRNLP